MDSVKTKKKQKNVRNATCKTKSIYAETFLHTITACDKTRDKIKHQIWYIQVPWSISYILVVIRCNDTNSSLQTVALYLFWAREIMKRRYKRPLLMLLLTFSQESYRIWKKNNFFKLTPISWFQISTQIYSSISQFCVLNFGPKQCFFLTFIFFINISVIFVNHNVTKVCFISE